MPRSSVTPVNVFPVASLTAVTVTPGRTPPVASVIVPVSVASCASAIAGHVKNMPSIRNRLTKLIRLLPEPTVDTKFRAGSLLPPDARRSGPVAGPRRHRAANSLRKSASSRGRLAAYQTRERAGTGPLDSGEWIGMRIYEPARVLLSHRRSGRGAGEVEEGQTSDSSTFRTAMY